MASPAPCPTCGEPQAGEHCARCLFAITFSAEEEEATESSEPWTRLAGFELHEEIGRGGMGVVYRARQAALDRVVAVKVLLQAKFAGHEERERFHREAQATARLKHPGIVGIIDIGEDDGVPWFSMEHVPGKSLEQLVREHPMEAREAAACVKLVAEAVQHAHDSGVLHRDLKPSNILLDAVGKPRVSDFGLARIVSGEMSGINLTLTGQALGSPGYAAPEQALGGKADVRTDVYGLGALLYHLLTGRPPFQGPTLDAILVQLRDDDPVSPRRLNPTVPRDLETICLQCLRKDPARRYATAHQVGDDLGCFLTKQPIRARPLSPAGQLWRWCQRRPWVAALVATSVILGGALVIGSLSVARREHREEQRVTYLSQARSLREENSAGWRWNTLDLIGKAWKLEPSPAIRQEAIATLSLPDFHLLQVIPGAMIKEDFTTADGSRELRFEGDAVILTEKGSGKELARIPGFGERPLFHADDRGRRIAIVRKVAAKQPNAIEIHDLADGKVTMQLHHDNPVTCLDWSGELLVAGGTENRLIHVWDTTTGRLLHRFSGHQADIEAVKFRKDGQEFVSLARDGLLRVWHAGCGEQLVSTSNLPEHAGPVEWSDDGTRLRLRRSDGSAIDVYRFIWPRSVRVLGPGTLEPRSENIPSLRLDRAGRFACTVDETASRLWSLETGRLAGLFPKDQREWLSAVVTPDASGVWLAGWNSKLRHIPIGPGRWPDLGPAEIQAPSPGPLLVAISPIGGLLASTQNETQEADDHIAVTDPVSGRVTRLAQPDPFSAAFSENGMRAVTGSFRTPGARLWSLPGGKMDRQLDHPGLALGAVFTHGDEALWLWGDKAITRWNTSDWSLEKRFDETAPLAFTVNPTGKTAASATRRAVILHRAEDLSEIVRLEVPQHSGEVGSPTLAFSGNGEKLSLHTADGTVVTWDLVSLRRELRGLKMDWEP